MFQEAAFVCGYFVDCVFPEDKFHGLCFIGCYAVNFVFDLDILFIDLLLFTFCDYFTFEPSVWQTFVFKASTTVSRLLTHQSS